MCVSFSMTGPAVRVKGMLDIQAGSSPALTHASSEGFSSTPRNPMPKPQAFELGYGGGAVFGVIC